MTGEIAEVITAGSLAGVWKGRRMSDLGSAPHLDAEFRRLLAFGSHVVHPAGGAAWLGDDGTPLLDRPVHTYITARMAQVFSLGALAGVADAGETADALVGALLDQRSDDSGWPSATDGSSDGADDATARTAYDHAFVVLAGATATVAGRPGGQDLLTAALPALERFWEPRPGMYADRIEVGGTGPDPYRGVNANMHAVEALLATADAAGEDRWRVRALRVATTAIDVHARAQGWRIPEHFTADWEPLPDHHRDQPDHPFQPYGATVGHGLEWSRLLLHLDAALTAAPPVDLVSDPGWLRPAAVALYDRALADGWAADGADGFVYTTDWDSRPVVHDRMHWVVAEAVAAAAVLYRVTGQRRYAEDYARYWAFAERHLIDRARGSWFHQLDRSNRPAASVWSGKPDLYHVVQATLLPRLPAAPGLAVALREGLLGPAPID